MRKLIKYSDEEIESYVKDISKAVFIGYDDEERFQQIKYKKYYIPYLISSYGRVISINYHSKPGCIKVMKQRFDKNGYCIIGLNFNGINKTLKVHRLVAKAFIPNPYNKKEVNHKDGCKYNNHITNLEWVTTKENLIHAREHNLIKPMLSEDTWSCIYSKDQIISVCELLQKNIPIKEISKITGVKTYTISHIHNHTRWKNLSNLYDFSNFHNGRDINKIHKICELIEEGQYNQTEIANMMNVDIRFVNHILTRRRYKDISKNYNFNNYKYTKNNFNKVQRLSKV